MTEPYCCDEADAHKIHGWLQERGGIVIWRSVNLSNPGASWTTPYRGPDGQLSTKPTWQADDTPERHITDAADVMVTTAREVKRLHVAVQRGSGLQIDVTPGGSCKINREVARAREQYDKPAWYCFDYDDYENAVIMVEDERVPLADWITLHTPVTHDQSA